MATTPRSRMPVTSANFGNWLRSQQITGNFSFSATVVPVPSASAIYVGGRALPKLPEIDFNMTDTTKGKQKYSTILVVREEFQELASKIAALSLGSAKPLLTDTYTPKAKLPTSSDASTKTRDSLPLRSHLVVPSTSEFLQAKSAELATASVCHQCRGSHSCDLITGDCGINQITHNERSLLERVIYEFSGESSDVMIRSLIWFKGVQDLKIVHWEKGLLFRQGAWLSELVEDEKIFPWQDGKSLMDYVQTSQFSNNIGNYGNTIRNLKSIENVALHPLNSLGDILRDAKINYLQNKH
ncbi:hypothetical protein B2J93_9355 [Marssonina coronariae]|uniref:Uncharacterized protein n=1 Tax=Diplocarpon coronariae TaxID=2795749 RepID=A0A218Z871_9HELO|nr:hypothetical protein B2J93_9355 [Marssonina coronariae]